MLVSDSFEGYYHSKYQEEYSLIVIGLEFGQPGNTRHSIELFGARVVKLN